MERTSTKNSGTIRIASSVPDAMPPITLTPISRLSKPVLPLGGRGPATRL